MEQKEQDVIIVHVTGNIGIGLWTAICHIFCSIFGMECTHFGNKQNKVLTAVENRMKRKVSKYPDYEVKDYFVTSDSTLSYVATAILVKK